MAFNQKKNLLILMVAIFGLHSFASASPAPRGSIYSSTIEDGTPKVLKGTTQLDDESEEISNNTVERSRERYIERTKERVLRTPVQAKIKKPLPSAPLPEPTLIAEGEEFSSDEETTADSDQKNVTKKSVSEPTLEKEMVMLKKTNQELADRLSQLEKAKEDASMAPATNMTSDVTSKKMRTAGEKVPAEHIADLADRLKYANDIVKRFGIAYDYRTMTLSDFKRVLAKLEAKMSAPSNQRDAAEN